MTTPPDFGPSLVLVGSTLRKDLFGTGFIVEQTGAATRIVTCRHVVLEVNNRVMPQIGGAVALARIGNPPRAVTLLAIGPDESFDLAVIEVTPPLPGPPIPLTCRRTFDLIVMEGHRNNGDSYLRMPLLATIAKSMNLISQITNEEVAGWQIEVQEKDTLEPGYSGSPVVDQAFPVAFGVANARGTGGRTGLIVALSNLPRIWPAAARLFVDNRVVLFAHPSEAGVARELANALGGKIAPPVGVHVWEGSPLDAFMLETCQCLLIVWSQSLLAECKELVEGTLGKRLPKGQRVVPITLADSPPTASLEHFLPANIWFRYTDGADVNRLEWTITGENPGRLPIPEKPLPPAFDPGGNRVLTDIASACSRGSVTFVVGCAVTPESDVVHKLISLTKLPSITRFPLPRSVLPLDFTGTCFSISESDRALEREMQTVHTVKSVPALYQDICRIVQKAIQRPPKRLNVATPPQLIVTTSLDSGLEVALLHAGIPFLRLVHDRSSTKLHVSDFSEEDARMTAGCAADEILAHALSTPARVVEHEFEQHEKGQVQNPLQNLSLGTAKVVLYKLIGSNDIDHSMVLTTEQLLAYLSQLRPMIPVAITSILDNTDLLLLGIGHLDLSFRIVQQLLVRSARDRYLVQACPQVGELDPLRSLERDLWPQLKHRRNHDLGIETIEYDSASFVSRLKAMVTGVAP